MNEKILKLMEEYIEIEERSCVEPFAKNRESGI